MSRFTTIKKAKDTVARFLHERPVLTQLALSGYRFFNRSVLRVAAMAKRISKRRDQKPSNIFHGGVQRTGSRWIQLIFSDPRIRAHTGLWTYPRHEYEINGIHRSFPKYTFVPGLAISYEQYIRIEKPSVYRTFYVVRDPRDLILSWYKSISKTHRNVNDSVEYFRNELSGLNKAEGIVKAIKMYSVKLSFMRDWVENSKNEPEVLLVKFEDLVQCPVESYGRVLDHCRVDIPKSKLNNILLDYDKKKIRNRDQRRRNNTSDYSGISTNWKNEFQERHKELFKQINGDIVSRLGYTW